jgi:hypothetical protein
MRLTIVTFCLVCFAGGMLVGADDTNTRPATQPSSVITKSFQQLGDADPQVREQARIDLMGLKRSDLESLRAIVQRARFVSPQQASVLRDVVLHVYLAGQSLELEPEGRGCLGIKMGDTVNVNDDQDRYPEGVIVRERIPGFCAYRMLCDGDVICGIAESPRLRFTMSEDVSAAISGYHAGDRLNLIVRRGGRIVRVPVTLDPRPVQFGSQLTFDALEQTMLNDADNYWERNFAPLVEPSVSSAE